MKKASEATPNALLRHARKEKGWTQEEAASKIGVDLITYNRWERGITFPTPHSRQVLTNVYGKSEQELGLIKQGSITKPSPPSTYLTTHLTPLIGREMDISAVCEMLQREDVRLITLLGPPGVGKTELSKQIENQVRKRGLFKEVIFVPLEAVTDVKLVLPTIAEYIASEENFNTHDALEYLIASLHKRQALLILDNFEQITEAGEKLIAILANCQKLKILLTSRRLLNQRIGLGHVHLVTPLALPKFATNAELRPEALQTCDAVKLFLNCAQRRDNAFTLTKQNAQIIAELCVGLDGLPFALAIAASRVKELGVQGLRSRLRDAKILGLKYSAPNKQREQRHDTLDALIAWSYNLLTEEEKKLFRRLAVFRGGCSLKEAAVICSREDLPSNIESLAHLLSDWSLLMIDPASDPDKSRLRTHNTIRAYAKQQLTIEEAEIIGRQHRDFYLEKAIDSLHDKRPRSSNSLPSPMLLHAYDKRQGKRGQTFAAVSFAAVSTEAFDIFIDKEWENLFAALEWTAENDIDEEIAFSLWSFIGSHLIGHPLHEYGLELMRQVIRQQRR